MIKIDLPDLPDTATSDRQQVLPIARVYAGSPWVIPPFLEEDVFAPYPADAFGRSFEYLGLPNVVGRYRVLSTTYEIVKLHQLLTEGGERFSLIDDPLQIAPNTAWFTSNAIHCYTTDSVPLGDSVTAVITSRARLPVVDLDYNFTLSVDAWTDAVVVEVSIGAFRFTPATSTPKTGEFVQTGNSLKLYGSETYQPSPGTDVLLTLATTIPVSEPQSVIATFDFSDRALLFLDSIDYLGVHLSPARDAQFPQDREFIWNESSQSATVFLDWAIAGGLPSKASQIPPASLSEIGAIVYPSTR